MTELCSAFERKGEIIEKTIWGTPKERFVPHGIAIKHIREDNQLSLQEFGKLAGWDSGYQKRIEQGIKVNTISKRAMNRIQSAVKQLVK